MTRRIFVFCLPTAYCPSAYCFSPGGAATDENSLDRLPSRLRVWSGTGVYRGTARSRLRRGQEHRYCLSDIAESRSERYADLAAEMVRLNVDVIVANGTSFALAVKKATRSIPIVVPSSTDPVGTGLVASMARPGGNVTGLTTLTEELGGKQLELLKEIVAGLNRVAILRPRGAANDIFVRETEPTARTLGIKIIPLVFRGPEDFDDAFRSATKERVNGFMDRLGPTVSSADRKRVVELTVKNRLPSISGFTGWADNGGLLTYGADRNMMYRRAAVYVDKILKGAKPADLPVEAPTKFELIVNLKTAKQIGVTIPQKVLSRADRVIK